MKKTHLTHPHEFFQTFKPGKLYFKFIADTELEANGWTGDLLAKQLEAWGFIKLVTLQKQDQLGRFTPGPKVYYELPGKQISKRALIQMVLKGCPKPPSYFRRLFPKKESV